MKQIYVPCSEVISISQVPFSSMWLRQEIAKEDENIGISTTANTTVDVSAGILINLIT